jgi:hypothetical protein
MTELTITIDTNCINARPSLPAMTHLERLHADGRIQIGKTDVLDTELSESKGAYGQAARRKSAKLVEDMGTLIIGHSRIGHARVGSDDDQALYDSIAGVIFGEPLRGLHRRQVRDVMMLATHMKNKRDLLVTLDKDLLDRAEPIQRQFGVTVLTPDECLVRVEGSG